MHHHCEHWIDHHPRRRLRKHLFLGLSLIAIGVAFFMVNAGLISQAMALTLWPALIAIMGLVRIVTASRAFDVVGGVARIAVAGWLYACLEHIGGWTFRDSWPAVIIVLGLMFMAKGLLRPTRPAHPQGSK
ncbi:hypothetical protein [Chitinimonas sp.]|uniref:LiaF transmembrane domain-containing protein n=1 Tax=Chitinimonas sp. TaxID=1934313 RepID=UPI0035B1D9AD